MSDHILARKGGAELILAIVEMQRMSKSQRTKGAKGELEFVHWLRANRVNCGDRLLSQARDGGADGDVPVDGVGVVEVKRRARIVLDALAKSADVLAVRGDRGEWWVCLRGERAAELLRRVQE